MATVVMFHDVLGKNQGVQTWVETLEGAGHTVHAPDLFEGQTYGTVDEGVAAVQQLGFDTVLERGKAAVDGLPAEVIYLGTSLGVVCAEMLTITRPGAKGAVFLESCVPADEFGAWPEGVPVQIHGMDDDPSFVHEGDIDAARALVSSVPTAELFLYPGNSHLFTNSGGPDYDEQLADQVREHVLTFIGGL